MRVRRPCGGWTTAAIVVPFAALLALHAWHYFPFISDDALISLRYADRLLDGDGLTWNDGERVEGYSNLLWILAVAALGLIGIDLVVATRVLGIACSVVVLLSLACTYSRGAGEAAGRWALVVTLAFVTLAAPIAVWSIGGLEQPLYAALLAISIASLFWIDESPADDMRAARVLSLALGLLCLTRPDGAIFTAAVASAMILTAVAAKRPVFTSRLLLVAAVPAAFVVGQLGFRLAYYGELVPNTALVKLSPSGRWLDGWRYFQAGVQALLPVSAVAIAGIIASTLSPSKRHRGIALLSIAAAWSGYTVFIGGDIFPAYRHFVPLIVVLAFGIAEGATLVGRRLAGHPLLIAGIAGIALLSFIPFARTQFADKQNQRAIRERWEWECRDLALTLKRAFWRQQPLVAVTAAGCLPYWSELPSLDMLGLNDYYLPRHPPADVGAGFIGHELGDGDYVLDRRPDLIVFNVGSGPHYRSGEELDRTPEFHEQYVPTVLSVPGLEFPAIVYVRKNSPKVGLGITRAASALSVPGFLLKGTTATLTDADELVAWLAPGASATLEIGGVEGTREWSANVRGTNVDGLSVDLETTGSSITIVVRSNMTEPAGIEEIVLKLD